MVQLTRAIRRDLGGECEALEDGDGRFAGVGVEAHDEVAYHRDAPLMDAVDGVLPLSVIEPATSEELAGVLKAATAAGLRVIPRGGATKIDWGNPPRCQPALPAIQARIVCCVARAGNAAGRV